MTGAAVPATGAADAARQLRGAVDTALAYLRTLDPAAAAEIDALRRREVTQPGVVVVGETKRGKSCLVNMLVGVPGLVPVDDAVATGAYLRLIPGPAPAARAWLPGQDEPVDIGVDELRDWATPLGRLPDGVAPPRRIDLVHPAPLLAYLTLVDTPGTGGLDPAHAQVSLDAVGHATALLFVADAAAPLSRPELDFLAAASARVNLVLFALTKIDAYAGWRTILADNQALLRAHAPRFAAAPWYPVSARLAELARTNPAAEDDLVRGSRIADLQHALIEVAAKGHALTMANLLRAVRSELVRLDGQAGDRIRASDPDPAEVRRARAERAAVAQRKRTESRQWTLALNAQTTRARLEATTQLRTSVSALADAFGERIDRGGDLGNLPSELDQALHALSVRLSDDLQARFRTIGEQVLSQVFSPEQLQHVLSQLNARLRHALGTRPRRDTGPGNGLVVMSSAGIVLVGTRAATFGAGALGLGSLAGGLVIPVIGVGLGLAAGAYMVWKRRSVTDRQQARAWLREVLADARAALGDEITHRFTDLQYALTLALDEAIEQRLRQLDEHLEQIDQALAEDQAERGRRKATLVRQRESLRARIKQVDEVLVRVRQLAPAAPADTRE